MTGPADQPFDRSLLDIVARLIEIERELSDFQWELATPFGIAVDSTQRAWHSGKVNDVITLPDGFLLVGASPGGLWLIEPDGDTTLLNEGWGDLAISCLARGPDFPHHAYAGTEGGGLFVTPNLGRVAMRSLGDPLTQWERIGGSFGRIYRIAVVPESRRVVLATSAGVFMSDIPSGGTGYSFELISELPLGTYSGLARGPGESVVVAAWGRGPSSTPLGLYVIDWPAAQPRRVRQASIGGADPASMHRTSIASSPADGYQTVYAVSASSDDGNIAGIYAVLVSTDGGLNWAPVGGSIAESLRGLTPLPGMQSPDSGNQGDYNNCIAVSPNSPSVLALGWRRGPWVSTSGGLPVTGGPNWIEHGDTNSGNGRSPHLHPDIHSVYFDPNDASGRTLFVASDGGVASTPDLGTSWKSSYNKYLSTLEVRSYEDEFAHPVAASAAVSGLVAIATQDNEDLYAIGGPPGLAWGWTQVPGSGGDGIMVNFIDSGTLLFTDNGGAPIQGAEWVGGLQQTPAIQTFSGGLWYLNPDVQPGPGLASSWVAPVLRPTAHNTRQELIWAIASEERSLYRLVGHTGKADLAWESVSSVPSDGEITGLACADGSKALIATAWTSRTPTRVARFFEVDCLTGATVELGTDAPSSGRYAGSPVSKMVMLDPDIAFCNYNSEAGSFLLRFDRPSLSWKVVPNAPSGYIIAVDADGETNPFSVFIATPDHVFACRWGEDWIDVSDGLPKGVALTDMRFVRRRSLFTATPGRGVLYVGTDGRSLWRGLTW